MENQFFVDSEFLSDQALEKKHRIESDPSCRTNHMEYMEGMEAIESDVCKNVMEQMNSYDYTKYTAKDVRKALDSETCTIEDFKALLLPSAEPFWRKWHRGQGLKQANTLATPYISSHLFTLQITAKTTAFTAVSTATTTSSE